MKRHFDRHPNNNKNNNYSNNNNRNNNFDNQNRYFNNNISPHGDFDSSNNIKKTRKDQQNFNNNNERYFQQNQNSYGNNISNNNNNNNNNRFSRPFSNQTSNYASNNNQQDKLSNKIWNFYKEHAQSIECFKKKLELKDVLFQMFRDIFPYLGVYIVGSSANGFGLEESDVDICLMISHEEINQKTEAIFLLKMIARALRKAGFIKKLNVIAAKVPIIKFYDTNNDIECDININNHIGIRNTHLLHFYSEMDWRVKPLVLNIKRWANHHDINDASKQTISSYSLALMAIYYMQGECSPPILPVLQKIYPNKFNKDIDIRSLRLNEELPQWNTENNQSLGELFMGFIEFYSNFEFEKNIISVRLGSLLSKQTLPISDLDNNYSSWKFILIEEPFNLTNTARSVFDYVTFGEIKNVFRKSNQVLKQTKSYDALFHDKFSNLDFHDSDYE